MAAMHSSFFEYVRDSEIHDPCRMGRYSRTEQYALSVGIIQQSYFFRDIRFLARARRQRPAQSCAIRFATLYRIDT